MARFDPELTEELLVSIQHHRGVRPLCGSIPITNIPNLSVRSPSVLPRWADLMRENELSSFEPHHSGPGR
jgi:hypothetical protein